MQILNAVLNAFWLVLNGWALFFMWFVAGCIMAVSIIGIPFARACFVIAKFSAWPFGREAVDRQTLTGREDIGTGIGGLIGNIIWLIFAGWWLALAHILAAFSLCLTIIGIPFGLQHIKFAQLALMPIGKSIVSRYS